MLTCTHDDNCRLPSSTVAYSTKCTCIGPDSHRCSPDAGARIIHKNIGYICSETRSPRRRWIRTETTTYGGSSVVAIVDVTCSSFRSSGNSRRGDLPVLVIASIISATSCCFLEDSQVAIGGAGIPGSMTVTGVVIFSFSAAVEREQLEGKGRVVLMTRCIPYNQQLCGGPQRTPRWLPHTCAHLRRLEEGRGECTLCPIHLFFRPSRCCRIFREFFYGMAFEHLQSNAIHDVVSLVFRSSALREWIT